MYAKGYKLLFWGMIFLTFNINLGFINILPDFLGYILIYSGLNILSSQHKLFIKGKIYALILILLTIKDVLYDPSSNILAGNNYNTEFIIIIIPTIVTIIKLYLIYILCKGIYDLCKEYGLDELMDRTALSWKIYLIVALIYLAYAPFSINLNYKIRTIILIIIGIIQIITCINVASLFSRCKVELESEPNILGI